MPTRRLCEGEEETLERLPLWQTDVCVSAVTGSDLPVVPYKMPSDEEIRNNSIQPFEFLTKEENSSSPSPPQTSLGQQSSLNLPETSPTLYAAFPDEGEGGSVSE